MELMCDYRNFPRLRGCCLRKRLIKRFYFNEELQCAKILSQCAHSFSLIRRKEKFTYNWNKQWRYYLYGCG